MEKQRLRGSKTVGNYTSSLNWNGNTEKIPSGFYQLTNCFYPFHWTVTNEEEAKVRTYFYQKLLISPGHELQEFVWKFLQSAELCTDWSDGCNWVRNLTIAKIYLVKYLWFKNISCSLDLHVSFLS